MLRATYGDEVITRAAGNDAIALPLEGDRPDSDALTIATRE